MITYVLDFTCPSNGVEMTPSFTFPDVKSDPNPVLVQGPAGELFNFTTIANSNGNAFDLVYVIIPPKAGPPPHIHHWEDEWFYFPEGGLIIFGSTEIYPNASLIPNGVELPKTVMRRYKTKPGDLIFGPAFYAHGYINEDNVSHPVINVFAPGGISNYFFRVGQILTTLDNLPTITDTNKKLFVSEAPNFGMNMSSNMNEYAASWEDDLELYFGNNPRVQELLKLLENITIQNSGQHIATPHPYLITASLVFSYSAAFLAIQILSVLF